MNIGLRNANDLRKILLDLENGRNDRNTETLPDEESKPEIKAPEEKPITASIVDVLATQNGVLLIKENTQKIQNLTREMNNLQVPTNPTKSECDNLRARINTMKDDAKNLFGACEKWLTGNGNSEIKKAYAEFTQTANRKELEVKLRESARSDLLIRQ